MQKTAQKRSILNKLREMTNVSGIAAEKFFNPEFEKVMNNLRMVDDKIRAIASGETVGDQSPDDDTSLKELLKNIKTNLNRREYMTAVAFAARFHKKAETITQQLDQLNLAVDQVHHDFLFKDLDDEQKKYLAELKTRFAARSDQLVAEAGIMDFLVNVSTERGKALAAWEKRYPKQVGKLKKDLSALYNKAESYFNNMMSIFKDMATARATRSPDNYIKAGQKLVSGYRNYDSMFKTFYQDNVKGFLEHQQLEPAVKKVDPAPMARQQVVAPAVIPDLETNEEITVNETDLEDWAPTTVPSMSAAPSMMPDEVPTPAPIPVPVPKAQPVVEPVVDLYPVADLESQPENDTKIKGAHQNFYHTLEAMSQESPAIMANFIRKYALSIQDKDFATAVHLLKIAKSIGG